MVQAICRSKTGNNSKNTLLRSRLIYWYDNATEYYSFEKKYLLMLLPCLQMGINGIIFIYC
jgi:hypothetical protein